MKWVAGVRLPFHKHPVIEQSLVLKGSNSDLDGIASAGESVWRTVDSQYETYSEEGCVILVIYHKPNTFRNGSGYGVG
ncbi:MAG: cupin domain-containing protein [Burkholderiaceae bacterium]